MQKLLQKQEDSTLKSILAFSYWPFHKNKVVDTFHKINPKTEADNTIL